MIYRYVLIILACATILYGIQVPNFVIQYEQRLDAHYNEVQHNLSGFQKVADEQHGGSLEALIDKHRNSRDATFRSEADAIQSLKDRFDFFSNEKHAMQGSLLGKVMHLAGQGQSELIRDTFRQYSFSVPLNSSAIISGLVAVVIVLLIVETLKGLMGRVRRRKQPPT